MLFSVFYIIILWEPERRILGECRVWIGRSTKRRCVSEEDCVMYVPILETLQMLLMNEAVLSEVCLACCIWLFKVYIQHLCRLKGGILTHL